jgi:hypothetical protein
MKLFETITPDFQEWIRAQKLFFVATAPLSANGHVNLSPKGHDCLRILNDRTVCYLDMTGSGNETSAHILENERITLMWCGFEGSPRILRLYGRGEVVLKDSQKWKVLVQEHFADVLPSARQIIVSHVDRVQTSCGYAVPFYDYKEDRETLKNYMKVKEKKGAMQDYWKDKNLESIDGLTTPMGAELRSS